MKKVFILLSLLALTGCSYYQAASKGRGKYTGRQVESCSVNILGIPLESEKSRLDETMRANNLMMKDIYSVENKMVLYFGYLYFKSCTVVSLNHSAVRRLPKDKLPPIRKLIPELNSEFKNIKSMKGCDKFMSLEKSACRKELYRRKRRK